MAMGSASEWEYRRSLCLDLESLGGQRHASLNPEAIRVKRMLASLLSQVDKDRGGGRAAGT